MSAALTPIVVVVVILALVEADSAADREDRKELARSVNDFALDFLRLTGSLDNQFFSPFGIHSAFSMLALGAGGETLEQLERALHLPRDPAQLERSFGSFPGLRSSLLRSRGKYNLTLASRLFAGAGSKLLKKFKEDSMNYFDADVELLDFLGNPEGSVRSINDWASCQTGGKIKELLAREDVDPNTRLFLVNAVDFRGTWRLKFNRSRTRDSEFYVSETRIKTVPMMSLPLARLKHASVERLTSGVLDLPYDGDSLEMLLLLPNSPEIQLEEVKRNLTAKVLDSVTFQEEDVQLSVPRLRLAVSYQVNDLFRRLQVDDLFTPGRSDLSGVDGTRDLYVSRSVHGAIFSMDEEGTEASGVTSVAVKARKALYLPFIVDRPFLFLVRDVESGLIVFLGQVVEP